MRFLTALFRCRHHTVSRVFSKRGVDAHWVVCMDCGRRLEYDWQTMEVGAEVKP